MKLYICQKSVPTVYCEAVFATSDKEAACQFICEDVKSALQAMGACPELMTATDALLNQWVKSSVEEGLPFTTQTTHGTLSNSPYYAFVCIQRAISLYAGGNGYHTTWTIQELSEDQMSGIRES